MQIGMIGLGRMGGNMVRRLLAARHQCVVYDRQPAAATALIDAGALGSTSVAHFISQLESPRVIWLMLPAAVVDSAIADLSPHLSAGDIVVDGGNSNYKDTMRRAGTFARKNIDYVDCGTSGGVWGLAGGYSLMIGGDEKAVERLRPIFETLAPAKDQGWGRVGPVGAGHFTKMIHNGIEYGLMQAYAEGFSILQHKTGFNLDLHQIAEIWRSGSVVRSWLLDLTADALRKFLATSVPA